MAQSQEVQLEYQITNSDKLCGQGNINSLVSEDGYWKSYIGTDKTQLRCLFKKICRQISIEIRIKNADMIEFTTYINKNEQSIEMKILKLKEKDADKTLIKLKNTTQEIDQIFVDLHCLKKKQVQITWLRFYGIVLRNKPQKKVNVSKKQNAQIFNQRVKQTTIKKAPSRNIQVDNEVQRKEQKHEKTKEQNERQQVKERDRKKANLDIYIPENFDMDQLVDPEQVQMKQSYKTILVTEEQLNNISGATEQWLEMQRKMQSGFGVDVEHKLSVKISPKCLTGLKFCLANIYGEQKAKYVKIIKQLGGLVRQEPSQGCIVATPYPKGSAVGIAKIMVETHIVKLAYIDECNRTKNKVRFKAYQFRPDEFLV